VQCNKVEAFCHEDQPAPVLAAWSQHVLRHSDCSTYHGLPYELVTLQALQAAATGKQPAALTAHKDPGHEVPQQHETNLPEAVLLGQLLRNMEQQQQSTKEAGCVQQAGGSRAPQELLIALGAVAAGAVFVAIVAVVLAVRREEALPPITSATTTPARSASEVYQALVNSGGLAAPRPAACVGSGLSVGLQPPLQRDDSGDSCLSQVISIGHLRGGLREPLLHQSVSR
jgi:hypothetical protein